MFFSSIFAKQEDKEDNSIKNPDIEQKILTLTKNKEIVWGKGYGGPADLFLSAYRLWGLKEAFFGFSNDKKYRYTLINAEDLMCLDANECSSVSGFDNIETKMKIVAYCKKNPAHWVLFESPLDNDFDYWDLNGLKYEPAIINEVSPLLIIVQNNLNQEKFESLYNEIMSSIYEEMDRRGMFPPTRYTEAGQ